MGGKRLLLWNVVEIREEDPDKEQRLKQRHRSVVTESWGASGWKGP